MSTPKKKRSVDMKTRKELVNKIAPGDSAWSKIERTTRKMIAGIRVYCQTILSWLTVWGADFARLLLLALAGTVLLMAVHLSGCAGVRVGLTIPCPKDPVLEQVEVKGGTISGREVDDVVANQLSLWQHIRSLKALGCKS